MTASGNNVFQALRNSSDQRLGDWGPYSKNYAGISHVADNTGLRFDLSIFPGFYRRSIFPPNVLHNSGYYPWEASGDLNYFSYRQELEWKDRVYCDVSSTALAENCRLLRFECVNRTDVTQNLMAYLFASLQRPKWLPCSVILPPNALWVDSREHQHCRLVPDPAASVARQAFPTGEVRSDNAVGALAADGFGGKPGDGLSFNFELLFSLPDAVIILRYKISSGQSAAIATSGIIETEATLTGNNSYVEHHIPVGKMAAGKQLLKLTLSEGTFPDIDGFAVCRRSDADAVKFISAYADPMLPEIIESGNQMLLKYPGIDHYYGIWSDFPDERREVKEYYGRNPDDLLRRFVHNHTCKWFIENPDSSYSTGQSGRPEINGNIAGANFYTSQFFRPLPVQPKGKTAYYVLAANGARTEVERSLNRYSGDIAALEKHYREARANKLDFSASGIGKSFSFSQEKMAATVFHNIVYPAYAGRQCIKHFCPGKWWDRLYTWDSGFIGLGLCELNIERAIDSLNTYLLPQNDGRAFVLAGSPVPVQHYLFLEIWNRTRDRAFLQAFYPGLKKYYDFLIGCYGSSTTRDLQSGLLRTWDYFYNSGGWDDYPPQQYVHRAKLERLVTPVVSSAHAIRSAKILRRTALELNIVEDVEQYDKDIALLENALQTYSWDEEAGYFSYVVHDAKGVPREFLRDPKSGNNFNMGLDGIMPLASGTCNLKQEKILIEKLQNKQCFRTSAGIVTVDKSAPYYRADGYWNGAIWMPYQWFIWKTMLDCGMPVFAREIAFSALELWQNEVSETYCCFEHFIAESGRGAGWHHFSGLSSPVLNWFAAYFTPGRLTGGFELFVKALDFSPPYAELKAEIIIDGNPGKKESVIAVMGQPANYIVSFNGKTVPHQTIKSNALEFDLPQITDGTLEIKAT